MEDEQVRNRRPGGRHEHLHGEQLMKHRIKQRHNFTDEQKMAIDAPFTMVEDSSAYVSEPVRFTNESFAEQEFRTRETKKEVKRMREAKHRSTRVQDEIHRIEQLEAKQFSKLSALMTRTSATASSVSYDIVTQHRFPGIWGQLLKHEENAKLIRDAVRSKRCEERVNGEFNILNWNQRRRVEVPKALYREVNGSRRPE